jgi:DNA-binding helix-hairpin-helix protein with protein kinase domain
MDLYLAGKKVKLDPARSLGKGGEADVYDIGNAKALKVFKQPDHPDFAGMPEDQNAARERLDTHQQKLRAFPMNLPLRVITPEELAYDKSGKRILGYTMPLLTNAELLMKYGERAFRQGGIGNDDVLNVFRDLHATVGGLHRQSVVIGDFNDLNVLVTGSKAYLIDADSFQFKNFFCRVFTARFADPLLCDPQQSSPMLYKPHTPESDWYAYAIMLMQSLLFVGPYGGVYRPRDAKNIIPHDARPMKRITVFDSEVRYPKPAVPFNVLPDELLHHFAPLPPGLQGRHPRRVSAAPDRRDALDQMHGLRDGARARHVPAVRGDAAGGAQRGDQDSRRCHQHAHLPDRRRDPGGGAEQGRTQLALP